MCPNFASLLITRDGGETNLQRNSWKGILLIKKRLKSLQEFTPILFACYEMAICPNFEIHCLGGMVPPLSWWRVKLLRTSWTFVWFHYLHVDENVNRFAHFVSGAITLMSWWYWFNVHNQKSDLSSCCMYVCTYQGKRNLRREKQFLHSTPNNDKYAIGCSENKLKLLLLDICSPSHTSYLSFFYKSKIFGE